MKTLKYVLTLAAMVVACASATVQASVAKACEPVLAAGAKVLRVVLEPVASYFERVWCFYAVVTTKSTAITNRDATPPVINDGRLERSNLRNAIGSVTAVNGDSIASKYILASVPSTAMVRKVLLSCAAITSGAGDIGVYRNTKDGGAVVSVALFASAQSIAAALTNSDVTNESTTYTIDKREQPLWQAAGLSADPQTTLDIVMTLTAATTAGGLLGIQVDYVDNGS